MPSILSTRHLPLIGIVLLVVLVTGDARVETRFAAGFNRRNRSLKGSSPLWTAELTSASQCLSACIQFRCQSLTYGNGRCQLFPTFLCHPHDRFHLSLVPAEGVTYFDLRSEPAYVKTVWTSEGCLIYGRCIEKCNEGLWIKPTMPSTPDPLNPSIDGDAAGGADPASIVSGTSSTLLPISHDPFLDSSSTSGGNAAGIAAGTAAGNGDTSKLKRPPVDPDNPLPSAVSQGNGTTKPEELGANLRLFHQPKTFNESLEECKRLGMSLAMPVSRDEHDILVEAMKKRRITRMWIGVRKLTESGKDATYIDGRPVANDLLLWGDGQPNNSRGRQICVEMISSLKYLWNDFDCLYKSAFVCR